MSTRRIPPPQTTQIGSQLYSLRLYVHLHRRIYRVQRSPPPCNPTCGSLPCYFASALTGATALHRNKADFLCPDNTPQAPSNGRSSFQPTTRLLESCPIFKTSSHTCKAEDSPTKS